MPRGDLGAGEDRRVCPLETGPGRAGQAGYYPRRCAAPAGPGGGASRLIWSQTLGSWVMRNGSRSQRVTSPGGRRGSVDVSFDLAAESVPLMRVPHAAAK